MSHPDGGERKWSAAVFATIVPRCCKLFEGKLEFNVRKHPDLDRRIHSFARLNRRRTFPPKAARDALGQFVMGIAQRDPEIIARGLQITTAQLLVNRH